MEAATLRARRPEAEGNSLFKTMMEAAGIEPVAPRPVRETFPTLGQATTHSLATAAGRSAVQCRGTIRILPDRPPLAAAATAFLISLTS